MLSHLILPTALWSQYYLGPILWMRKLSSERFKQWLKVTQLLGSHSRPWPQAVWLQSPCSYHHSELRKGPAFCLQSGKVNHHTQGRHSKKGCLCPAGLSLTSQPALLLSAPARCCGPFIRACKGKALSPSGPGKPDFPWTLDLFSPLEQCESWNWLCFPPLLWPLGSSDQMYIPALEAEACFNMSVVLFSFPPIIFHSFLIRKNFIALLISSLVTSHSLWQEASLQINTYTHEKWITIIPLNQCFSTLVILIFGAGSFIVVGLSCAL